MSSSPRVPFRGTVRERFIDEKVALRPGLARDAEGRRSCCWICRIYSRRDRILWSGSGAARKQSGSGAASLFDRSAFVRRPIRPGCWEPMRAWLAFLLGLLLGLTFLAPLLVGLRRASPPSSTLANETPVASRESDALGLMGDVEVHLGGLISNTTHDCPPCDMIFNKVKTNSFGARVQVVEMQERGEPKSGTTFMFEWAGGLLIHACTYLKTYFGQGSCEVRFGNNQRWHTLEGCTMTFQPRRGAHQGPCQCDGIERVQISISKMEKHALPVRQSCEWHHDDRIAITKPPCTFKSGAVPKNFNELWRCLDQSGCELIDDRPQMAVFRDPRPMAVSSYFHLKVHPPPDQRPKESLDEYVKTHLPYMCQWIAVRFIVFQGMIKSDRATAFWYEEALADPLTWHHKWLSFVGLRLPNSVVEVAKKAALNGNFSFISKYPGDEHPGGERVTPDRSYTDELKLETVQGMDDVLRLWLPPALLARYGISAT